MLFYGYTDREIGLVMNEEQKDEIEALGSIFGEDFEVLSESSHKIMIAPYPGQDNAENHGMLKLF